MNTLLWLEPNVKVLLDISRERCFQCIASAQFKVATAQCVVRISIWNQPTGLVNGTNWTCYSLHTHADWLQVHIRAQFQRTDFRIAHFPCFWDQTSTWFQHHRISSRSLYKLISHTHYCTCMKVSNRTSSHKIKEIYVFIHRIKMFGIYVKSIHTQAECPNWILATTTLNLYIISQKEKQTLIIWSTVNVQIFVVTISRGLNFRGD